MIIAPATHNFTFYQNATWEFDLRLCGNALTASYDPTTGVFATACPHERLVNSLVVLTPAAGRTSLPLGFKDNKPYYIIADGFTATTFKLSDTLGGSEVLSAELSANPIPVTSSVPIDLTGYTLDCDVSENLTDTMVTSFTPTIITAAEGLANFTVPFADTLAIDPGTYRYDVSLTDPELKKYYYLAGQIICQATVSRA